ncbi:hypothetical protein PTKU64_91410 (plasmid) [Paraburkholderia terrae]|uniref:Uncharacterized protein n=1 Tax=Paraburkholderia terrae TaxID=311230 RepID=A0ABN6JWV5_9BURK|nr:hypothetical protein [Paraburkholderia terrae]BCZ85466.1 hypothetical protein PTKU64_91410 [Paraburkholderia terrae]
MKKLAKTLLVAAVAGLTAAPAFSCSLMDSTTDTLRNIINQQGGYPISDEQCAMLNAHRLRIHVDGDAVVLDGVNVAWADVTVVNADHVIATKSGVSTRINRSATPSQTVANQLFFEALEHAVRSLDWNAATGQFSSSGKSLLN